MLRAMLLAVCLAIGASATEAATLTVCASGCQFANLQGAIDAAAPGDLILLRAGETFTGNLILRAKSSTSTSYITIRSDAPLSSLPAVGVRLIPEGRAGANVGLSSLARLIGSPLDRAAPVIRTEPGAHHYQFQFVNIHISRRKTKDTLTFEQERNRSGCSKGPAVLV